MSYILDALKKADAERERSAVPGLHTQSLEGLVGRPAPARRVPWLAVSLVLVTVLAAVLGWTLLSGQGARTPPLHPAAPGDGVAAAPAVPAPTPAPTPTPANTTAAAPAAPSAAPPTQPPTVAAAPTPTPTPAPSPAPPAVAQAAPAAQAPVAAAAPARPSPPPAPVARAPRPAPPPPEPRVPALSELPADVRASLPPLAISGAVYSPTPSQRLLFIGGQVLREGDAVADGVKVERIGASASVLSVRGQRFELRH